MNPESKQAGMGASAQPALDRLRLIAIGHPGVQGEQRRCLDGKWVGIRCAPMLVSAPPVQAYFRSLPDRRKREPTGSATLIARLRLLDVISSLDPGDVTGKGSINQRAVPGHRAALVDVLHAPDPHAPFRIVAAPHDSRRRNRQAMRRNTIRNP
ncbi:hypothetical protein [Paraburkholderia sp. J63]|uniref:hypothetical protein n=1 Tax=Paraburkholderia sp. J63 TaxID=2805434 RepID=UPI0039F4837C